MASREYPQAWEQRRDSILQRAQDRYPEGGELEGSELGGGTKNHPSARKIRLKMAFDSISRGKISAAFDLGIRAETHKDDPHTAIRIGHRLKGEGHFDIALDFFTAAVRSAQRHEDCDNAVFDLGHCAKIVGDYGLAVECFAFVSHAICEDAPLVDASRNELRISLASLTQSFTV